jgi:hypothetical protein
LAIEAHDFIEIRIEYTQCSRYLKFSEVRSGHCFTNIEVQRKKCLP